MPLEAMLIIVTFLVGGPLVVYPVLRWAMRAELGEFESRLRVNLGATFLQKEVAKEKFEALHKRISTVEEGVKEYSEAINNRLDIISSAVKDIYNSLNPNGKSKEI